MKASSQRNRAAVLWALGGCLLLQLAYFPAVKIWPMLQDVEYGDKLKNLRSQLADKPKDQPSVVMLGSSLTGWGFNPSELETVKAGEPGQPVVFNFGINSGGVIVELICLRRLLADGIRPDLVLLETHPQYLFRAFNTVPGEHYLQEWRFQFQDLDVLKRYDPKYADFYSKWVKTHRMPWYLKRHEVQNYLIPHWSRRIGQTDALWTFNDKNGWEHIPIAIEDAEKYTREQIIESIEHRISGLNRTEMEDLFKQAYREIVETCRQENVPIVMVRMPETSYARDHYSPELRKQIDSYYAELIRETDLRYIDASDWVVDSHFPDGFHLHPRGAAVFMKRLERELLGSFMASKPVDRQTALLR